MIQIRFHGRGGQGVVTAAELTALAAFNDGHYAQAFPSFGVERSGAPIQAFARIADTPIITREQISQPDILIIQDASLLENKDVLAGISARTKLIINSDKNAAAISALIGNKIKPENITASAATEIALRLLGKNIVNTVILGAFARATGLVTMPSLLAAIAQKFDGKSQDIIQKNHAAITAAYNYAS